ncbi:recombinase family protein [Streptomyces sp. 6N223]|uniref:recombinase family protein n=1 Tax=Streptomyces sp. 6N223 TaxID=3457412 RepID=UPI003FD26D84
MVTVGVAVAGRPLRSAKGMKTHAVQAAGKRPELDLLVRKSKIVRDGEHALSLRAQEERGRRWADQNGYRVRKVWKENLSAYSDVERPKCDAAMKAVLDGEVPALWCFALDRFSRKGIDAIGPILGKARVIFDYEQLDSSNKRDRRWIIQRAEDAREYSLRLSYNIRSTKTRQRNEGRWLGRAPFGLVVDTDRKLKPDTKWIKGRDYSPWDIILRIFKEVSEGLSARAVARKFTAEGITTGRGKSWRADSVRSIVIHPVYEGWLTVTQNKRPVPYLTDEGKRVRCVARGALRRMIPATLAEKARRVLSGHQIIPTVPREGRRKHLLSGLLTCAGCGRAMVADSQSYVCHSRASGRPCPAQASVMRGALERYVSELWLSRMNGAEDDDPLMIAVAQRWTALMKPEETAEIREAVAAVRAAEAALEAFHADDRAGFYAGRSAKYRLPAKREAEERLTATEERLAELSGGAVDVSFLLNGQARGAWEAADDALRRDLLGLAVERIAVTKASRPGARFVGDDRVTVQWATPAEQAAEEAEEYEQAA